MERAHIVGTPLEKLSLVVVTLDEEDHIERCLGSVPGAGEKIVVDSFSRDRTVELATRSGARVLQRPFVSAADQKGWAIARATGEWILVLDADETATPRLVEGIAAAIRDGGADGYWIRRRSEFLGKRIRFCGWGNERILRLFRRGRGTYPERAVHERLVLDGRAAPIPGGGTIEHRPYRDMADYLDRMRSYSDRGALELEKRGARWFPGIVTHPVARFLRMYVLQLGFLDGASGFTLCALAAKGVYLKYARLRELRPGSGERGDGEGA